MRSRFPWILPLLLLLPACGKEDLDDSDDDDEVTCDVGGGERADVAFLVDQSDATAPSLAPLAAAMDAFWTPLAASTSDWQLMVVSAHDGCNASGLLSDADRPSRTAFETGLQAKDGWQGNGMEVATWALEKSKTGMCNESFLRAQAFLHLVFVSGTDDASPETWDAYLVRLRGKKLATACFRASAVVPSTASAYEDLVSTGGGLFLDLEGDWNETLAALADASVGGS
jgi:hypothetical protein